MEEIIEGVFHWKAVHPNTGSEAGCHFVAGSGTAIDPLLPDEGIEWFGQRGVERVVLSTRHHLRHAPEIAERFGCPILCHESGLYEFEDGPAVEGFAFGDRLADDVVALEMDAISPDDTVLRVEANGAALRSSTRASSTCSSPTGILGSAAGAPPYRHSPLASRRASWPRASRDTAARETRIGRMTCRSH